MTAVADEEVLRAAELDLSVADFVGTTNSADGTDAPNGGPVVRILKGSPTDDELAALACVLSSVAAKAVEAPAPEGPRDMWGKATLLHHGASPFAPYAYPFLSYIRG